MACLARHEHTSGLQIYLSRFVAVTILLGIVVFLTHPVKFHHRYSSAENKEIRVEYMKWRTRTECYV